MFNDIQIFFIFGKLFIRQTINKLINPLASPSAEAPALNYGDVNTVTPSPGEVKGLILNNKLIYANVSIPPEPKIFSLLIYFKAFAT